MSRQHHCLLGQNEKAGIMCEKIAHSGREDTQQRSHGRVRAPPMSEACVVLRARQLRDMDVAVKRFAASPAKSLCVFSAVLAP